MAKKVYKALDHDVVEKKFIGEHSDIPKGWFETTGEAKAAFVPSVPAPEPKKAGRPKKADPDSPGEVANV